MFSKSSASSWDPAISLRLLLPFIFTIHNWQQREIWVRHPCYLPHRDSKGQRLHWFPQTSCRDVSASVYCWNCRSEAGRERERKREREKEFYYHWIGLGQRQKKIILLVPPWILIIIAFHNLLTNDTWLSIIWNLDRVFNDVLQLQPSRLHG